MYARNDRPKFIRDKRFDTSLASCQQQTLLSGKYGTGYHYMKNSIQEANYDCDQIYKVSLDTEGHIS